MGLDGAGIPVFTLVGQTAVSSAGRVGVGLPTITTYQGQAGTGIVSAQPKGPKTLANRINSFGLQMSILASVLLMQFQSTVR